jgi:hypothetical protein
MDFSWAFDALKAGLKVTRSSWKNSRFLWLKPAVRVEADWCHDPVLKALAEKEGGVPATDTISVCFQDAGGIWVVTTGWVPQQYDLFADDWIVYLGEGHEKQTPEEIEAYKKLMLERMPGSPAFRERMLDLDRAKMEAELHEHQEGQIFDKLPKAGSMENCGILSNAINQLLDRVTCMPNLVASVQQGPEDKEFTITIREKSEQTAPLHVEGDTQFVHHEIIGCHVINPDGITKSSIGGYGLNDKVEG